MSQKLEQRPKSQTENKRKLDCDVSTNAKSKKFMKQMLALPISNIVYLRGIFDEEYFSKRYIGDMEVRMLKDLKTDDNAHLLIEWMSGCFDALEKDYLKSATLTIHDLSDPHDNPIESYTFSISYKDDNTSSLSMQRNGEVLNDAEFSEKNLKAAAIDCLTNLCNAVDQLETLPDEVVLNMELSYRDEVTPKDYEPRGFRPSKPKKSSEPEEIGEVETQYHRLCVKVYTRQFAELSTLKTIPKISETTSLFCADHSTSTVGVVSPTVRPTPMETDAPSVSEATLAAHEPTSGKGGKRGRGKETAAGWKGGKRKACDDSPSEKNSEAEVPGKVKRAKRSNKPSK